GGVVLVEVDLVLAAPIGHLLVFQAEDGIRDFHVTGVQTCALPIFTDHALNPGGFLVVGDVGFPDRKAFELAREHWAREWDEEAFYWVGDEAVRALQQAGFGAVYTQVTVSAGVLVIRPGRPSASD